MEKVKVSKEVFKALESAKALYNDRENVINCVLEHHARGTFAEGRAILHELTLEELARFLINGYELEETPEEKILNRWNAVESILPERRFYYREGILDTLRLLGIKIKGINE